MPTLWHRAMHLIHRKRSPFPSRGRPMTLREGERVRRSPHPPLTRSPFSTRHGFASPRGEGINALENGIYSHCFLQFYELIGVFSFRIFSMASVFFQGPMVSSASIRRMDRARKCSNWAAFFNF